MSWGPCFYMARLSQNPSILVFRTPSFKPKRVIWPRTTIYSCKIEWTAFSEVPLEARKQKKARKIIFLKLQYFFQCFLPQRRHFKFRSLLFSVKSYFKFGDCWKQLITSGQSAKNRGYLLLVISLFGSQHLQWLFRYFFYIS